MHKIAAHTVGGHPAETFHHIGFRDPDPLSQQGYYDKSGRRPHQNRYRFSGDGGVNEMPDNQRACDLQPDKSQKQCYKNGDHRAMRIHVPNQKLFVRNKPGQSHFGAPFYNTLESAIL